MCGAANFTEHCVYFSRYHTNSGKPQDAIVYAAARCKFTHAWGFKNQNNTTFHNICSGALTVAKQYESVLSCFLYVAHR
jgi:hypothetical protein